MFHWALADPIVKATLPVLDNPFSQRVNAIIQKTRELRRGPYYPHLYVVKEDGEAPLRLWALSALIQDRAEMLPSYQQFITNIKDRVCLQKLMSIRILTRSRSTGTRLIKVRICQYSRFVNRFYQYSNDLIPCFWNGSW